MRPVQQFNPRAWLLKALRESPHAMEALLWEHEERDFERRGAGGDEWSIRHLAAHLCEMERRYAERLQRIATAVEPKIAAFDADSIEPDRSYEDLSVFELMDEFGGLRQRSAHVLWSLEDSDWERKGRHPYLGLISVFDCAREMNEHDLSHLWQMRRLCDSLAVVAV